jgi:hypothetical protein
MGGTCWDARSVILLLSIFKTLKCYIDRDASTGKGVTVGGGRMVVF